MSGNPDRVPDVPPASCYTCRTPYDAAVSGSAVIFTKPCGHEWPGALKPFVGQVVTLDQVRAEYKRRQ